MTKRTTISISRADEPAWEAWRAQNRNTSAALMRLIRRDLRTKQGGGK